MSSLTQEKDSKMLADEKPKTLWSEAFKRFKRDKLAIVGAFIILLMLIFAFTAKFIAPYDPTYQFNNGTTAYGMPLPLNSHSKKIVATKKDINQEFTVKASTVFSDTENKLAYRTVGNTKAKKGMTSIEFMVAPVSIRDVDATPKQEIEMTTKDKVTDYLSNMKLANDKYFALGTDSDGRDSLSRLIWGAQVSLEVGMLAVGFATVIGVLLGLLSGFFGGWVDMVIMRFTDIMMSMPDLLLVMALVSVLPSQDDKSSQGVGIIIFAIGIVSWTGIARLVRSQVFSIKEMEYVEKIADRINTISVTGGGQILDQLKQMFISGKK
ncbi:MAG: ABC transporter permease [Candidatus Sericytochromatia bacterium]